MPLRRSNLRKGRGFILSCSSRIQSITEGNIRKQEFEDIDDHTVPTAKMQRVVNVDAQHSLLCNLGHKFMEGGS